MKLSSINERVLQQARERELERFMSDRWCSCGAKIPKISERPICNRCLHVARGKAMAKERWGRAG